MFSRPRFEIAVAICPPPTTEKDFDSAIAFTISFLNIKKIKSDYQQSFKEYKKIKHELTKIEDEEKKIVELKEFASFEIKKIEDIDPKLSEDEELLEIKKELNIEFVSVTQFV